MVRRLASGCGVLALGLFALVAIAPAARAATGHILDPTLSLAGSCGVASLTSFDEVEDPGCPYPPPGEGGPRPFNDPCGVATDAYGDIYLANGATSSGGSEGVIDVFSPAGRFLTAVPNAEQPCTLTVDSLGRIYVRLQPLGLRGSLVRYDPTTYEPLSEKIAYGPVPTEVLDSKQDAVNGPEADTENGLIYVARDSSVDSIEPDGTGVQSFGVGELQSSEDTTVWGQNGDVYVTAAPVENQLAARAFVIDGTTGKVKKTISGCSLASEGFSYQFGRAGISADQVNGDFYVADVVNHHVVDQFNAAGECVAQLRVGPNGLKASEPFADVAVDEGPNSPNKGYVYATSGNQKTNSHLYAFAPLVLEAPEIKEESALEITTTEAVLSAQLNPHGAATTYQFEYGTADCGGGTCQSVPVPAGNGGSGAAFHLVSAAIAGLAPGTTYHFRLVASSHCNPSAPEEVCVAKGPDRTFVTYPAGSPGPCENAALRVGASARLPDCRAYELVTPSDTNGRVPTAALFGEGRSAPPFLLATVDGSNLLFGTEGGAIPGLGGGGFHDSYLASRQAGGWRTEFAGLDAAQAHEPTEVGISPDHAYSLWAVAGGKGTLSGGEGSSALATYIRLPSGAVEPLGVGSLGVAPRAEGNLISAGTGNVVFSVNAEASAEQDKLEAKATANAKSIYDRTPGGPTRVVSLLPGDQTPADGESATYLGAAPQAASVVFRLGGEGGSLYERVGDSETVKVTDGPASFGGISTDGSRVVYVKGGDIFSFEVGGPTSAVGSGGKSTLVNVSADGSHVYFVSPVVMAAGEANGNGEEATVGAQNLYAWDAASNEVHFVGMVEPVDVEGEVSPTSPESSFRIEGLGLWVQDLDQSQQARYIGPADDPSRTTADGRVFVFESRASLTAYENAGHPEIYRYEAESGRLDCISCSPVGAPPSSRARLEAPYPQTLTSIPPVNASSIIENIAAGGNRVYFESGDSLSFEDTDQTGDVYEWEAEGAGGCTAARGCIQLISSGHSGTSNYLYGVGASGRDVFFWTGDTLTSQDQSDAPSIYDAREGGGFPETAQAVPCAGDACQGPLSAPPPLASPGTSTFSSPSRPRHHRKHHRKRHRHHSKRRGHRGQGR